MQIIILNETHFAVCISYKRCHYIVSKHKALIEFGLEMRHIFSLNEFRKRLDYFVGICVENFNDFKVLRSVLTSKDDDLVPV